MQASHSETKYFGGVYTGQVICDRDVGACVGGATFTAPDQIHSGYFELSAQLDTKLITNGGEGGSIGGQYRVNPGGSWITFCGWADGHAPSDVTGLDVEIHYDTNCDTVPPVAGTITVSQ